LTEVEAFLVDMAGNDPEGGTTIQEMQWAFSWVGGREMECVAKFTPDNRPLLGDWLDSISPTWRRQWPVIAAVLEPGSTNGHRVLTWGDAHLRLDLLWQMAPAR
jgi:hypothetical protein